MNPKVMSRKDRLKIAKRWAESISTAKKIKAYRKHFGVDKLCAAKELMMAGVALREKYAERWATRLERKAKARKIRPRKPRVEEPLPLESDDTFYFIAGYTAGGFAYGTTWVEAEAAGLLDVD